MKLRLAPKRYLCCVLLIASGVFGILLSPSIGVHGGIELKSFTINKVQEYAWGAAVISSDFELPYVQNQRGLAFMNCFLAGSLASFFGGVHWFTSLRRRV
jgi:hypothetical protein